MNDVRQPRRHPLHRFATPLGVAIAAVLLLQALSVDASRPIRYVAEATPVAVVDVSRVFDQIEERSDWDMRLDALRTSIEGEIQSRQQTMNDRLAEGQAAATPEERQKILDQVALMQFQNEQWLALRQNEIDREESLKWRSIYRNLRREAQRVAEAEGYAMVLVDDSVGDVKTMPDANMPLQAQVLEQISSRRILFAQNAIDITDQVIVRMNNSADAAP